MFRLHGALLDLLLWDLGRLWQHHNGHVCRSMRILTLASLHNWDIDDPVNAVGRPRSAPQFAPILALAESPGSLQQPAPA